MVATPTMTQQDTDHVLAEDMPSYVFENMVGTRRLELLTSTVSR